MATLLPPHRHSDATAGAQIVLNAAEAPLRRNPVKKFIIATLAASLLATPVLAAPGDRYDNRGGRFEQNDRGDRGRDQRNDRVERRDDRRANIRNDYRRPAPAEYRSWSRGQRFDSRYARNYRVIGSPRAYRLNDAPRGYRWVQSGNDAVLIGLTSGIVASVLAGVIR
jgi:Ni/Co efflux regulator RcnB